MVGGGAADRHGRRRISEVYTWPQNKFYLTGEISGIESEKIMPDGTLEYKIIIRTKDIMLDKNGELQTFYNEFPLAVFGEIARQLKPRLILCKKVFVEGYLESSLNKLNIPLSLPDGKETFVTVFDFKNMFLIATRIVFDHEISNQRK